MSGSPGTGGPGSGSPGTGSPEVRVLPSPDALSVAAAGEIARALAAAIEARGVAHWATTGGSAAPGIYRRLAAQPLRDAVDWSRVHVWWGDDRFVPPDHPLSNVEPLEQILLASGGDEASSGSAASDVGGHGEGVRIPAGNLHPVPVTAAIARAGGAAWAAAAYATELAASGPPADDRGTPVFDIVVVGVGPDGHVLSVFPGSATWDDEAVCVAVPAPAHVEPHVDRVTMHPRVLAAARRLLVVVAGSSKASAVGRAWAGDDARELPLRATRIPSATWLLDEAAAGDLPRS